MAAVVAGPDLGGGPAQPEQDGRVPEQEPLGRVDAGFGEEWQGGEGAEQQPVVDPLPPVDGELVEGLEDPQLDVEGDQLVEWTGGRRRGHQGPHAAADLVEEGLRISPEPLDLHGAPPRCATAYGLNSLTPIVCFDPERGGHIQVLSEGGRGTRASLGILDAARSP
jgi:hypothetical protein